MCSTNMWSYLERRSEDIDGPGSLFRSGHRSLQLNIIVFVHLKHNLVVLRILLRKVLKVQINL